ncbi:DUF7003 family protein [Micromonospora sp. NPDC047670]
MAWSTSRRAAARFWSGEVAQVLAAADPTYYPPTLPPNTHWSSWPMSGQL